MESEGQLRSTRFIRAITCYHIRLRFVAVSCALRVFSRSNPEATFYINLLSYKVALCSGIMCLTCVQQVESGSDFLHFVERKNPKREGGLFEVVDFGSVKGCGRIQGSNEKPCGIPKGDHCHNVDAGLCGCGNSRNCRIEPERRLRMYEKILRRRRQSTEVPKEDGSPAQNNSRISRIARTGIHFASGRLWLSAKALDTEAPLRTYEKRNGSGFKYRAPEETSEENLKTRSFEAAGESRPASFRNIHRHKTLQYLGANPNIIIYYVFFGNIRFFPNKSMCRLCYVTTCNISIFMSILADSGEHEPLKLNVLHKIYLTLLGVLWYKWNGNQLFGVAIDFIVWKGAVSYARGKKHHTYSGRRATGPSRRLSDSEGGRFHRLYLRTVGQSAGSGKKSNAGSGSSGLQHAQPERGRNLQNIERTIDESEYDDRFVFCGRRKFLTNGFFGMRSGWVRIEGSDPGRPCTKSQGLHSFQTTQYQKSARCRAASETENGSSCRRFIYCSPDMPHYHRLEIFLSDRGGAQRVYGFGAASSVPRYKPYFVGYQHASNERLSVRKTMY